MLEQAQPFATFRRVMASLLMMTIAFGPGLTPAFASSAKPATQHAVVAHRPATATPIQYLVVIFQENVSFDHYFGTYPNALNPQFENKFVAANNTPIVNGLTNALLSANPNLNPANGTGATGPFRLDVNQANTNDQDHNYLNEQQAFDNGLMDLFPLVHRHCRTAASRRWNREYNRLGHGLLRRKYRNWHLELCATLRHER